MESTEASAQRRPFIKLIFISPDEPRLRAGWRLTLQTLLFIALAAPLLVFTVVLNLMGVMPISSNAELLIYATIMVISTTTSVFIARRLFDRRNIESLGLSLNKQAIEDLFAGFLIPALMMALIFFLEWIFGWSDYLGVIGTLSSMLRSLPSILFLLLTFILIGWWEELLSRGYHLQNLEDGINLPIATILSSSVFGIQHLLNPNSGSIFMVAAGIFLAGLFLAFAYVRTRQLWLPIGLHIGWNFFEGPIFGFPVSGIKAEGLFVHEPIGPELITGGAFGPEAGLIILPALALGVLLVYYITHGRNAAKIDGSLDSLRVEETNESAESEVVSEPPE